MKIDSAKRLFTVLLFLLPCLMWGYYGHTRQFTEQRLTESGFPERNFSDLFPRWLGARELLLYGRDPYSPEVTREIQQGYYGRPIDRRRATDPADEQRFAYPLFVVFLLAPTIGLSFTTVKWLFTVTLLASAAWTVLLWIQVLGVKAGRSEIFVCISVALATLPYAEGIQLQQLSVLVAFLLAAAIWALAREKFFIAGLFLAAATIKPQLCMPCVAFVLLWSVWKWNSRKRVTVSFLAFMMILLLASEALLPQWPAQFFAGISQYLRYTQATTGVHALLGRVGGTIILLLFAIVVMVKIWQAKSEAVDSEDFRLAISSMLAFTCVGIPSLAPHNQVLLAPAYLLLLKKRRSIWAQGRIPRSLLCAAWLTLGWPLVTGMLLAATMFFHNISSSLWSLPFATNPLVPITALIALIPLFVRPSAMAKGST